jgi:hypothetical protein
MTASAVARDTSQHGARVIHRGVAFELLCDFRLALPHGEREAARPVASVLCSVSADLPLGAGSGAPGIEWRGDRATLRARGVVAVVRHLAPRRYAVTAHVDPETGLPALLDAVVDAVRRRDGH